MDESRTFALVDVCHGNKCRHGAYNVGRYGDRKERKSNDEVGAKSGRKRHRQKSPLMPFLVRARTRE